MNSPTNNEQLEITIESIASGGEGVGRGADGRVIFVAQAAVGDTVRVEITTRKKSWARGSIVELIEAGPGRIEANCVYFQNQRCGGCQWLHLSAPMQVAAKTDIVTSALRHLISDGLVIEPMLSPTPPYGWRRRARLHWFRSAKMDRALIGFTAPKSRRITEFSVCSQLTEPLAFALADLRSVLAPFLHKRGEIDMLFGATDDGEPTVAVAIHGPFAKRGLHALAECDSIGSVRGRGVEIGPQTLIVDGGVRAQASDFAQASTAGNRALGESLAAWLSSPSRVLELFAGGGNLTRLLSRSDNSVLAVEHREPDVSTDLFAGLVEWMIDDVDAATKMLADAGEHFDVVVLDPPRTGAAGSMANIARLNPERILYISCNPATLARDALAIAPQYRPIRAQPLDLMPQTSHVEVVLELRRR